MKQQYHRIVLFYSHSSDSLDNILRDKLVRFLRPLIRETHVEEWSAQQILPGAEFAQERKRALESATHILLLLSTEYLASDVCYQEMLEALERQKCGKARVIPILLRPCLLPKPLEESLSCLPSNARPISVWQKRDKAFFDVARDICRILGLPLASLRRRSTHRDCLLDRVFAYWIEGLLEPSLKEGGAYLDLVLQEQLGMANPWSSQVQELRLVPRPSLAGRSLDQIYDHADGELLILGEPGAGKTMLLLELTRTLLERAERDERHRMPIVFHLSAWAQKRQSLRAWLLDELRTKYRIPHKIGQDWIDAGQVIPLLDGLDEVRREDARVACVEAINDYYQSQLEHHGSSPLVVCCRSEEYAALSTRLMFQPIVSIQPLTNEQINSYLEPFGEQVTALKQALDEDTELRKLARQPLALHFFTLAYQGVSASEVPVGTTLEKMQHAIFAKYVERMLNRRMPLKRWRPEQVSNWLTFLAKQMQQHDQTFFAVENLWLPDEWEHRRKWCIRFVFGLAGALALGGYFELRGGPVAGLIAGLVAGVYFGHAAGKSPKVYFGNAGGVPGLLERQEPERFLIPNHSIFSRVFRLVVLFVCEVVPGLVILGPVKGLAWGLVMYLLSLWEIYSHRKNYLSPNESIWDDGRGQLTGILGIGSLVGLAVEPFVGLFAGLCLGITVGLFLGLFTEGLVRFVDHFLLRIFFAWRGDLPWNLVAFLDEMANRLLMHKVGGSYMFVHWLLRDHLASQEVPASSIGASSNPSSPQPS